MKEDHPKRKLLKLLAEHHEIAPIRGSDIVAVNSKAILYLRYNKNAGPTKKYLGRFWFGITKSEYDKYRKSNFFLVCACGVRPDEVDYIVLPIDDFENIRENIPLRSGQWKFYLLKTHDNKYLLQITKGGIYDVTQYLNFFDFSPKELRKAFSPAVSEVSAPTIEKPDERQIGEASDLENELLMSARDSTNPKRLEVALERFFSDIGFKCERIGGSGETDVLITEPVRFIVDGKSTKSASKSAINFTRIKRHKANNNADFMVIVSVGFDPAVARDAEIEGATLVNTQTLNRILKLHREYIASPFDYIDVLKQPGLLDTEKLTTLQRKIEIHRETVNKSMILLENLDFIPRNVDEIKGRVDLFCEQSQIPKLEMIDLEKSLQFLSHNLLGIVKREASNYSLQFTHMLAKEKLKSTIRILCSDRGLC
jgi:hypothetical protein